MFKPKIQPITIEDDGESVTLYVRQAAANEILDANADADKKKKTDKERIAEIFATYIVSEDGKPITKDEVAAIMASRVSAYKKISDEVIEKIGLTAVTAKNA